MQIAQLRPFWISGQTFKDHTTLYFDFGDIWFQIALLTMSLLFWGVTWDEDVPILLDFSSENFIYFLLSFYYLAFSFLLKLSFFLSSICRLLLLYIACSLHNWQDILLLPFFIFLLFNWKYQIIKEIIISESYRRSDGILNT